jgi:hypothetical protein
MSWTAIFGNPWVYGVLLGMTFAAYGVLRSVTKNIPIINKFNKNTMALIFGVALIVTSGVLGSVDFGTASLNNHAGSMVSDFQLTTGATSSCTVAQSSNVDDLYDVRCTDAQVTDGNTEVNGTILTVTRSGSLDPISFPVRVDSPDYASESSPGDGTTYNVLEKNSLGELSIYLQDGGAATTSSPREHTALSFADGDATSTLGVTFSMDEEGTDALNQYSYRDVKVWVGNKDYVFRIWRMD